MSDIKILLETSLTPKHDAESTVRLTKFSDGDCWMTLSRVFFSGTVVLTDDELRQLQKDIDEVLEHGGDDE